MRAEGGGKNWNTNCLLIELNRLLGATVPPLGDHMASRNPLSAKVSTPSFSGGGVRSLDSPGFPSEISWMAG